jgi:hypothetical protein
MIDCRQFAYIALNNNNNPDIVLRRRAIVSRFFRIFLPRSLLWEYAFFIDFFVATLLWLLMEGTNEWNGRRRWQYQCFTSDINLLQSVSLVVVMMEQPAAMDSAALHAYSVLMRRRSMGKTASWCAVYMQWQRSAICVGFHIILSDKIYGRSTIWKKIPVATVRQPSAVVRVRCVKKRVKWSSEVNRTAVGFWSFRSFIPSR